MQLVVIAASAADGDGDAGAGGHCSSAACDKVCLSSASTATCTCPSDDIRVLLTDNDHQPALCQGSFASRHVIRKLCSARLHKKAMAALQFKRRLSAGNHPSKIKKSQTDHRE